jgi:hypothetical protein
VIDAGCRDQASEERAVVTQGMTSQKGFCSGRPAMVVTARRRATAFLIGELAGLSVVGCAIPIAHELTTARQATPIARMRRAFRHLITTAAE